MNDELKHLIRNLRSGGSLESISDRELLDVTAGAVDMGTMAGGTSDGVRGNRIVYNAVRDKQWVTYASFNHNLGPLATPRIMIGADPTDPTTYARRPYYYGRVYASVGWLGAMVAGEFMTLQGTISNGDPNGPDVTVNLQPRLFFTAGVGSMVKFDPAWPIVFQSLSVYYTAGGGTCQFDLHFEGWQYFVN